MASVKLKIDYPSRYPNDYDTLTISDNGSSSGTLRVKATLETTTGIPWSSHYNNGLYIQVDGTTVKGPVEKTSMSAYSSFSIEYECAYNGTAKVTAGWKGYNDNSSWTPVSGTVSDYINAGYNSRTLTLTAGNGIESVSGGGTYDYGSNVTISATAKSGYAWQSWSDGNTDNPRTISLTSNVSLTANAYHTHPTVTFDTQYACFRVDSDSSTTLSPQGEYAYIKFSVSKGTADVTNVKIGDTQLGTSEGTYTYWVKQDLTSATTYKVTVTDTVDSGATANIFIPSATIPLSLYDDGAGNIGVGIGVFAESGYLNTMPNLKLKASNGTTTKEATLYEILTKLGY